LNDTANPEDRANHAALMDKVYRRQRHIYDFTRKYYLLGRDRLVRELHAKPGDRVVEIGCGTARNLIHIAENYPDTKLYGLDASAEMLRSAGEAIAAAGLSGRIVLAHALADELTPSLFGVEGDFDHVVFSYSLSMIPDWRGALRTAGGVVRPQGFIHVVDFGDLTALWPAAASILRAWLRLFHVAPRSELLARLEVCARQRQGCSLHLLPGRYAFVFKASPSAIEDFVG
jgi:S-adenosylmethionine-diacylgycerolhomoserine-N-methlytransferase